jgi:hypothetical protein
MEVLGVDKVVKSGPPPKIHKSFGSKHLQPF